MINWLHITDWHVGRSGQGHLWPNLRSEFERDVARLARDYGGPDIVFLTGDLVQSGDRRQFDELEQNLKRMWSFFATLDCAPLLVPIPGNHDLKRPSRSDSAALALGGWHEQPTVREVFWDEAGSDLRRCVSVAFVEYEGWLGRTSIPLLRVGRGLLPGDVAGIYEKDGVRIGIVGLNSTFLQLGPGNHEKRVVLSARQFAEMCGTDYVAWLEGHHFSVLLTHHPDSWLSPDSLLEFRREVAPPGRFRLHLSGHLHIARTVLESVGGSQFSLRHQGASLFGLEYFGEEKREVRHHGYLFGQWQFQESQAAERLWPRTAIEKESGAIRFEPSPTCELEEDSAIHSTFELQHKLKVCTTSPPDKSGAEISLPESGAQQTSFLQPIDPADAAKKLRRALRFSHALQPHHAAVRSDERFAVAESLKTQRSSWIVTDWGMGNDGFLASVVRAELCTANEKLRFEDRIFQLRCDTFDRVAEVEQGFLPQFGIPVVDFLQYVTATGPSCLVLDGIQASLTDVPERVSLISFLDLLLDQAPTLSLVVVSRVSLEWRGSPVEIHALDLPDLRAYVQNHPNTQPEFVTGDVLERFFEASGGLPVHVDRMLERLRVASFDVVLDEEIELKELAAVEAPLHKALQQAIAAVRRRDQEVGAHGIALLRVLSILTYGETIDQLKQFLPGRPLFARDAEALHSAALIDPIPLSLSAPVISDKGTRASTIGPKVLRVPKQVRDRVIASLTLDEKTSLLAAAGEFFFGVGWRVGKKPKLRKMPAHYREYVAHGVGNEYAVLQLMIANAKDANDIVNLKAAVRLGIHYCGILKAADRNRDLRLVAQGLLRLIEDTALTDDICDLNRLAGRASRLTGHHEEAVSHFRTSLDQAKPRGSHEARTYAMLEMADSLSGTGDKDGAIETTRQVQAEATPGSLVEHQAKAKLVRLQPPSQETYATLVRMKKRARKKGWESHANDLCIQIAARTADWKQQVGLYDEILASKEEGWNRYRAATEKALAVVRHNELTRLSSHDRRDLLEAYSFSHTQRLELFDQAHEALWGILEHEGNREGLYQLFKHSSFIWRIRGDDATELEYFERLNRLRPVSDIDAAQAAIVEVQYFIKRAAVLLARLLGRPPGGGEAAQAQSA